jgi:hypothetical protein
LSQGYESHYDAGGRSKSEIPVRRFQYLAILGQSASTELKRSAPLGIYTSESSDEDVVVYCTGERSFRGLAFTVASGFKKKLMSAAQPKPNCIFCESLIHEGFLIRPNGEDENDIE